MATAKVYQVGETPWIRLKSLKRVDPSPYVVGASAVIISELLPGESIGFVLKIAGVTAQSGDTDGGEVLYYGNGIWRALLNPVTAGVATVRWTGNLSGGVAIWDDTFTVVP